MFSRFVDVQVFRVIVRLEVLARGFFFVVFSFRLFQRGVYKKSFLVF